MTKILTDESIRHAYERKVESCKSRNIHWGIDYNYYKMLIRNRPVMVCFYTGKQFDMRKTGVDAYPTMDRIDPSLGYTVENTVLCHKIVNDIKNDYWETGFGLSKGMKENHIHIYRSIEKVMSQGNLRDERMKPYQELYTKSIQREQEKEAKEMTHKANLEACEKAKRINEAKAKADEQLALARHYIDVAEEYKNLGMVLELTIKEFRDITRKNYCSFTKVYLGNLADKVFYVKDADKPLNKDNLLVCSKEARADITSLTKSNPDNLKNLMKALAKII